MSSSSSIGRKSAPTFRNVPLQMRLSVGLLDAADLTFAASSEYRAKLSAHATRTRFLSDQPDTDNGDPSVIKMGTQYSGVDCYGYEMVCVRTPSLECCQSIRVNKSREHNLLPAHNSRSDVKKKARGAQGDTWTRPSSLIGRENNNRAQPINS